jgi:aryl-alcohol dehydrogenase-like predicted oxidoreductase
VETVELGAGIRVSRIAKGNWQLAERHGAPVERGRAIEDMRAFVEAGITLFDCADHYVGVEELIGEFRRRHPEHAKRLRVSTKLVPDLELLPRLARADVERIVDTSLGRLGVERLDLVQFHWWDYAVPGYVEAMHWMKDLQAAGKIALLGTTNFDTPRLAEIVASGVPVATNQLQYSVLDRRPERAMAAFCAAHGIRLLCYGVLAGGFLSARWLGAPDPRPPFANRSLVKYRLIIEDFGGWDRFQQMLAALERIARRRGASLSSVAARYILDKPGVAVAIVGARSAAHLGETLEIERLRLEDAERAEIAALTDTAPGPVGDCYGLERIDGGPHGAIMWKNQNTRGAPSEAAYADAPPAYAPPRGGEPTEAR